MSPVSWLALAAFIVVPALVAVSVHALFRRFAPPRILLPHHDVAGFLVAVVGVLYAVVLGFMVVTVWTSFDDARRTQELEAGYVADALGYSMMLPPPLGPRLQGLIAAYAVDVRDREWPLMAEHQSDPRARALLISGLKTLNEAPAPKTSSFGEALKASALREGAFTSLKQIADSRRTRLIQSEGRMHPAMYATLIIGALMVFGFVLLFGVENVVLQLTMTAIMAGLLGLLLGVVAALDSPYSGLLRLSPENWSYVIENNHLTELAKGVNP